MEKFVLLFSIFLCLFLLFYNEKYIIQESLKEIKLDFNLPTEKSQKQLTKNDKH